MATPMSGRTTGALASAEVLEIVLGAEIAEGVKGEKLQHDEALKCDEKFAAALILLPLGAREKHR